jgi:hypothetical protein
MYPAFLRKFTEKNARKAKLASRLLDMVRFRRSSPELDLLSVSRRRLLGPRLAPLNKRILRTERQQIASAAPAVPTVGSLRRALVCRDRVRDGRVVLRFLHDCVSNLVLLGSDAITLGAGRSSQALMPARRVPEPVE